MRGITLDDAYGGDIRQDGLATASPNFSDNAVLERIEVVKGPASILGGASTGGGVINRVSRLATFGEQTRQVSLSAGSFDLLRADTDLGADFGNGVAGRVVAAYEDDGQFEREATKHQYVLMPSLAFQLGTRTRVTVLGEYQRYEGRHVAMGIPLFPDGSIPSDFPVDYNCCGPGFVNDDYQRAMVVVVHDFLDGLRLSARAGATRSRMENQYLYGYAYDYGVGSNGLGQDYIASLYSTGYRNDNDIYAGEIFLAKALQWRGRAQEFMIGADISSRTLDISYSIADGSPGTVDLRDQIDLPLPPIDFTLGSPNNLAVGAAVDQVGVFAQAVVRPLEGLTLVGALRHDTYEDSGFVLDINRDRTNSESLEATTGRFGLAYAITPPLSLYVSYAESFKPQPSVFSVDGETLPPETGSLVEAGLRAQLFDGRMSASLGAYRMFRENLATDDPANPNFSRGCPRSACALRTGNAPEALQTQRKTVVAAT